MCGYYRFAHIDGRITSNPAQYVRRPRVHPPAQRGMDRGELASFLYTAERTSPMHAALAVLLGLNGLRVSEACGTNIEDLGFERGHRILRIVGKGTKPADIHSVPRTARTVDLAIGERGQGPILLRHNGERLGTAHRLPLGWAQSASKRDLTASIHTCSAPRSSWPPWTPGSRWATCRSPLRHAPASRTDILDWRLVRDVYRPSRAFTGRVGRTPPIVRDRRFGNVLWARRAAGDDRSLLVGESKSRSWPLGGHDCAASSEGDVRGAKVLAAEADVGGGESPVGRCSTSSRPARPP